MTKFNRCKIFFGLISFSLLVILYFIQKDIKTHREICKNYGYELLHWDQNICVDIDGQYHNLDHLKSK